MVPEVPNPMLEQARRAAAAGDAHAAGTLVRQVLAQANASDAERSEARQLLTALDTADDAANAGESSEAPRIRAEVGDAERSDLLRVVPRHTVDEEAEAEALPVVVDPFAGPLATADAWAALSDEMDILTLPDSDRRPAAPAETGDIAPDAGDEPFDETMRFPLPPAGATGPAAADPEAAPLPREPAVPAEPTERSELPDPVTAAPREPFDATVSELRARADRQERELNALRDLVQQFAETVKSHAGAVLAGQGRLEALIAHERMAIRQREDERASAAERERQQLRQIIRHEIAAQRNSPANGRAEPFAIPDTPARNGHAGDAASAAALTPASLPAAEPSPPVHATPAIYRSFTHVPEAAQGPDEPAPARNAPVSALTTRLWVAEERSATADGADTSIFTVRDHGGLVVRTGLRRSRRPVNVPAILACLALMLSVFLPWHVSAVDMPLRIGELSEMLQTHQPVGLTSAGWLTLADLLWLVPVFALVLLAWEGIHWGQAYDGHALHIVLGATVLFVCLSVFGTVSPRGGPPLEAWQRLASHVGQWQIGFYVATGASVLLVTAGILWPRTSRRSSAGREAAAAVEEVAPAEGTASGVAEPNGSAGAIRVPLPKSAPRT